MITTPERYPVEETIRQARFIAGKRGKRSRDYLDIVTAFDIETTRTQVDGTDHAFMYVWQWAFENDVVIGRTWDQWLEFVRRINRALAGGTARLVCYIHNAGYEFSFIKGVWDFSPGDVFCVEKRRPLRFDVDRIECRCSYLHSGLSLKAWLRDMKAPHQKLDGGKFDYSITRYPWTPLTRREVMYCVNDVRGVVDAIRIEMKRDGDTLATIPLTKTGYVRRVMKQALHDNVSYSLMSDIQPDYDLYIALREAFRGGDTHASRFYAGRVLNNVLHCDRSSSYPDEMCNREFPMSRFKRIEHPAPQDLKVCFKHRKAFIIRVAFEHLALRSLWSYGCPYISKSKCRKVINPMEDNGRLLAADYAEMTITDIDYRIIINQYDGDMTILDMWSSRYALLPDPVRDVVRKLYRDKTALKGIPGQELIYLLSKGMINACYGMCAQDPAKLEIEYVGGEEAFRMNPNSDRRKILEASNRKRFLPYQIGVWVTAWARYDLHDAINTVDNTPGAAFVYCDTDSVFYLGDVDWSKYNTERRERSTANGAFADDRKGKRHYMGVMEPEDPARRFATMGAKKYAWQDPHGTLHITIAGVAKDMGARELESMGGLEKFVDMDNPPLFVRAGGTEIRYNDGVDMWITADGHPLHITDSAVIRDSTYQMGETEDYKRLLKKAEFNVELIECMLDL